ncbi:DUF7931 domain-containing protein [Endothiovibrio diazotrophicus]
MARFDEYTIGEDSGPLRLARREENAAAAARLATAARRSLHLFTRDLDPHLYNRPEFLDEVRRLALGGRRARVEVLVLDSRRAVLDGHRLIELGRRLSSFIELRKLHGDYGERLETFLIADERGLLYRRQADLFEGKVDFNAPAEAAQLLRLFSEAWSKSHPDPELRHLGI